MDFTLNSNGILNASGLDVRARRLGVEEKKAWIVGRWGLDWDARAVRPLARVNGCLVSRRLLICQHPSFGFHPLWAFHLRCVQWKKRWCLGNSGRCRIEHSPFLPTFYPFSAHNCVEIGQKAKRLGSKWASMEYAEQTENPLDSWKASFGICGARWFYKKCRRDWGCF